MSQKLNVGLLGCGNVGSAVARFLLNKKVRINFSQALEDINLKTVVVKNPTADPLKNQARHELEKYYDTSNLLRTGDAGINEVVSDPNIQIVVELMGGKDETKKVIATALENGKHVITANKAVIADYGYELFAIAKRKQVDLGIEASVCGAIPIISLLGDYYKQGHGVKGIYGILNGTTNFILTKMGEGMDYRIALKKAQELGFAEFNPEFDVSGKDAQQKLAILASIAFQTVIKPGEIYRMGIAKGDKGQYPLVEALDLAYNKHNHNLNIKLIGQAKRVSDGIEARICPMLVSIDHPLAKVDGAFNTVFVDVDYMGTQQLVGKGAGGEPTAYAVIKDLCDLVEGILTKREVVYVYPTAVNPQLRVKPIGDTVSSGYIKSISQEIPGMFALKARILTEREINISLMDDLRGEKIFNELIGSYVPDVIYFDPIKESAIDGAMQQMEKEADIKSPVYIRRFVE